MKDLTGPWTVYPVDSDTNKKLLELCRGERDGYVQIGPDKYFFPYLFGEEGRQYYEFKPRKNDVWIVTYPRSGTTLTQELLWIIANNFDFETALNTSLNERFPFLEFGSCVHPQLKQDLMNHLQGNNKQVRELDQKTSSILPFFETTTTRRFIKTHLPFSLLHPELTTSGAKIVYIARNPKDVAVSYYHLSRLFKTIDFTGSFQEFWDLFEKNQVMWSPFWKHLQEGWMQRNNPNVLFLFYEDIQKDMTKVVNQLARFLEKEITEQQVEAILDHVSIANFRNNASVNFDDLRELGVMNDHAQSFIRRGGSKESQVEFTPQLEKRADAWIEKNLQNTTMRFPQK